MCGRELTLLISMWQGSSLYMACSCVYTALCKLPSIQHCLCAGDTAESADGAMFGGNLYIHVHSGGSWRKQFVQ